MSPSPQPPVRDDLAALEGYHSPQVDVSVRLNTNESPEPPPPGFAEAVAAAVTDVAWHRYPDRAASDLRQAIADHHGVPASRIFAANGSNEVLQTLMLTYGGPARQVLTFEPTYALHGHIARITGTGVVEGERDANFVIDQGVALDLIAEHRPIITFLCSPNNPTGMVESPDFVRKVLDAVDGFGLLVVDEAYDQFARWSALELVAEDRPLVVTRTFSKTWSMAAARLGYLIAPSWLVERLDMVVLPYHLDSAKQAAGLTALTFADEMNDRVTRLVRQREELVAGLDRLGVDYWPSDSNFVLFRPADGRGAEVWQQLLDGGVLVRNCASWPRLDGCLRVTVGTADENRAFLDLLGEILDSPSNAGDPS